MEPEFYVGPERRRGADRHPDATSLVAGIVSIIGITLLLLMLGSAFGVVSPGPSSNGSVITSFGTWAFFSTIIGTFLGCMVGGLMTSRHGIGAAFANGLAACGGAIVLGAFLGALGVTGLVGASFLHVAGTGPAAVMSVGWNGWALFLAAVASFPLAVLGWVSGLAIQPRNSTEMRIEEHRFVRPVLREVKREDARL